MSSSRARRRVLFLLGALALLALVAAGCEPLVNAPPGGGQTVTKTFRYGPFTLGPGDEAQGSPSSGMPRPAGSFGLKSAKFDVVDEDGNSISPHDVHLHHIVMTTSARNDEICTGRRERFIGSGSERTPITLWGPYTYLVGANDRWGSLYHVMNETPAGTPPKTVYIEYTLGYQPGANGVNCGVCMKCVGTWLHCRSLGVATSAFARDPAPEIIAAVLPEWDPNHPVWGPAYRHGLEQWVAWAEADGIDEPWLEVARRLLAGRSPQ